MLISADITYTADPHAVYAMLTDEEFQARKCAATRAVNYHVDIRRNGDRSVIVTKRTVSTAKFPEVAKSLLGQTVLITETDAWEPAAPDGSRRGTLLVDVEGIPIKLTGTLVMKATPTGTEEIIQGDLKASVPLVGSALERAAAPAIQIAIDAENRVGHEWLHEAGPASA